MRKLIVATIAVLCLAGFSSLSFADEMGKGKGQAGEMKGEKGKKHDDMGEMKSDKGKMQGEMKEDGGKMKGEMDKGDMGKKGGK
jgi:hypothetical protein